MAMVTIQHVPVSETSSEVDTAIGNTSNEEAEEIGELISIPSPAKNTKKRLVRQGSISENFFAVKDAALILPRQSSFITSMEVMQVKKYGGDLQNHLYAIFKHLRPQDSIKLAVRLESWAETRVRYLVIVTTIGRQDTEENIILGMDFASQSSTVCTIGLVIPIWSDTTINLDGDGGFKVEIGERTHIFKPVSVQAMWSALQALHKCGGTARQHNYYYGSLFLTWTCYYESQISSPRLCLNEWEYCERVWTRRPEYFEEKKSERKTTELKIRTKLKEVMMKLDLDKCTTKDVRLSLERAIDLDLQQYKEYVETEMLMILGQMDIPSKILDFLYLGSGWNASNQDELVELGITHILNVTIEVDNYFPDDFIYKNVKLYDMEKSDLLQYWNDTWKFIKSAQKQGGKCLVHCKMGISRSGATVAAFLMKENLWTMEKALAYTVERREIVNPNKGFMRQLVEYEGILNASAQRHNRLFRSRSESNLSSEHGHTDDECSEQPLSSQNNSSSDQQPLSFDLNRRLLDLTVLSCRKYRSTLNRPKSWSPDDSRQFYLNDEDLIFNDRYEENSDLVRSHMSEPQASSERKGHSDAGTSAGPAYDKRKKWKRRHTERIFRDINIDLDAFARSEDSVFANPGELPLPRVGNWMTNEAVPNEKKKSNRLSSPAAIRTSKNNLAVEDDKNPSHSSVASPMTSPSFQSIKNVKVSDLKTRFSEESLVKLEMQENEMSIKVAIQEDIGKKAIGVREMIAGIESPTDEGLKLILNKENDEDACNEDFVPVRERSFSENQVFYVKNLVSEYESRYSPDTPAAPGSAENVTVEENVDDDQPATAGIARSQSLPSRRKKPISPQLQVLPAIEDKQSELSPCKSWTKNQNSNSNNNNNPNEFCSTTVIEFDDESNNTTASAIRTTSQPGCIITENMLPSDVALTVFSSESVFPDSHADQEKTLVRTLTQSQLQIIREVGKTLQSDSDDTTSIISNGNSSTTDMNSSSSTQDNFPSNKRGIVRRMARTIENGLEEQQKQNMDRSCVPRPADPGAHKSTTVINKLLMGESVTHPQQKSEISESNCVDSGKVMAPTASRYLSSSPSSSSLQDLINLVGPTPYSPTKKPIKVKKSPEKNEGKGIRRTQSERSVIRPVKMIFRNRHSKQHMRHASASKSHPELPTFGEDCLEESEDMALSFKPVKDIIRSIEGCGKNSFVKRSSSFQETRKSRYLFETSRAKTKTMMSDMKKLLSRSKSNPQFFDERDASRPDASSHTSHKNFKNRSHHKRMNKNQSPTDNPFYNSM